MEFRCREKVNSVGKTYAVIHDQYPNWDPYGREE